MRAALLCALLMMVLPARASEPEMFGIGPRSGAMAGTGAADASDWEATYENPAGLAFAHERRLTIGYAGARYRLNLDGAHRPVDQTNGVNLGATLPIPFGGALRDRFVVGLAFYFPTGLINRARDPYPDQPRLALLDNRTQVVSVLVAAGIRVIDHLSIGIGVLALAALVGEIDVRPDAAGHFTTAAEEQLTASYAPVAGVRFDPLRWLHLGIAYRGESTSTYDLEVKNSLGASLPIQLPTIRIAGTAQYDPHQVALEGAFDATRWLRFVTGATWKHWSGYTYPVEDATPGAAPKPAADYHDTVVPRLAIEATRVRGPVALVARLGYFFEWSPAPDGADRVLIDADRHVLTVGGGVHWANRWVAMRLDAFAQWHHLADSARASGDMAVFGAALGLDL